jgi:hypothetical protein
MSLASDMAAIIQSQVDLGEGETIEYRPYKGIPRMIPALIDRTEPTFEFHGGGEIPTLRYQVRVANHAVTGVVNPTESQDTFKLKVTRDDLLPVVFRLSRVLARDSGAYTLEVVK